MGNGPRYNLPNTIDVTAAVSSVVAPKRSSKLRDFFTFEPAVAQQNNLRGFLNREWGRIVCPASLIVAIDGLGKYIADSTSTAAQFQMVASGVLVVVSSASLTEADTVKRGVANVALIMGSTLVGAGLVVSTLSNSITAPRERSNPTPHIQPDTMIPAGIICQREKLQGNVPIEMNGKQFILTCG